MNNSLLTRALISAGLAQGEARALRRHLNTAPAARRLSLVDTMLEGVLSRGSYPISISPMTSGQSPRPRDAHRHPSRQKKHPGPRKKSPGQQLTVTPASLKAICYNLTFDKSPEVRRRLAIKLGSTPWEERVPLLGRLAQDPDPQVRKIASAKLQSINPLMRSVITQCGGQSCEAGFVLHQGAIRTVPVFPSSRFLACNETANAFFPFSGRAVHVDNLAPASFVFGELEGVTDTGLAGGTVEEPADFRAVIAPPPAPSSPRALAEEPSGPPAASGSADAVRRFTDLDFKPRANQPQAGDLTFCLRIRPRTPAAHAVDVRIPPGRPSATILVHASSLQFSIDAPARTIKVPRDADSEMARFVVQAHTVGQGEVSLLIYDEFHLIGSLEVQLRASESANGLALEKIGQEIFRDPAPAERARLPLGFTLQLSVPNDAERRIEYQALLPVESDGAWQPSLVPVGQSSERFDADYVQSSLRSMRSDVDGIEQMLGGDPSPDASRLQEILQVLRINLEGTGRQIADDLLSPEVRAIIAGLGQGTVVHWVIANRALDAVPWELACDPLSGRPLSESILMVRVPVRDGELLQRVGPGPDEAPSPGAPSEDSPAGARLVYLLGDGVLGKNVVTPARASELMEVVQSAGQAGYDVVTNFRPGSRDEVSLEKMRELIRDARVIHLLCHGVVEEGGDMYLKMESVLGRLRPQYVRALRIPANSLVFVNACSSASAAFSVAGLTTFGWEFRQAGAAVYIGTLAPVTTTLALRFARAFFDAYLGRALSLHQAVFKARQAVADEPDPTWILYAVYGDLHRGLESAA